jgi:hypothetical protein
LGHFGDDLKFVLLTAKKQYACATKEEALTSFLARKERQIKILEANLERAKRALALGKKEYAITAPKDLSTMCR